MGLFLKLTYQKYNFNKSGKWLRVVGKIPIFFLGRGSEASVSLASEGFLSILEGIVPREDSASQTTFSNLAHKGCFGSLPTHVGVLLKDPSGGPWGVVNGRLGPLYYILPI